MRNTVTTSDKREEYIWVEVKKSFFQKKSLLGQMLEQQFVRKQKSKLEWRKNKKGKLNGKGKPNVLLTN